MIFVVIDPSYVLRAGHHHGLNAEWVTRLEGAETSVKVWADRLAPLAPSIQPAFSGMGYAPAELWSALPASLQLAEVLRLQIEQAASDGPPVAGWMAHSLLPFQLLGFARFLQDQPAASVFISLMFDPAETLGAPALDRQALRCCRMALLELSLACNRAGHRLQLGVASLQTLQRYRSLLQEARLPEPRLHPAVVGAGCTLHPLPAATPTTVLLHWGDLKPDKGRCEALQVVRALLQGWQPPQPCRFVFHSFSHQELDPEEEGALSQARQQLGNRFEWLVGEVPTAAMQQRLAGCDVALLPYSPSTYAHRSSGVLWCYAAARYAAGLPAAAIGYAGHWLQREAEAFGMVWHVADAPWPVALSQVLEQQCAAQAPLWTPYATEVLGRSFADWLVESLSLR